MALPANTDDRTKQSYRDAGLGSDGKPITAQAVVPGTDSSGSSVSNVWTVGGTTGNSTASFTRPADTTAYAIGDLVANSTTAGSVVPLALTTAARANPPGSFILRRLRLMKTTNTLTNASFRVYLFATSPTVAVGDNAAFNSSGVLSTNNSSNYLGSSDITIDTGFSDGAKGFSGITFSDIQVKLASGITFYALIEARAAYAPGTAEQFFLTAEDLQD